MTRSAHAPLLCEIRASSTTLAADLARTVAFCAEHTGIALEIITRPQFESGALITLQIPPEHAAADDSVWCFVCRLACLCPQARVGALVPAADAFAPAARHLAG